LGEHRERVTSVDLYSGPWWVGGSLLAMIGERRVPGTIELEDGVEFGYQPALVLLDTAAARPDDPRARVELGVRELFAGVELDPAAELPGLLDLRPAGEHDLLITTERCLEPDPERPLDDDRPCLHRVHAETPLAAVVGELVAGSRTLADALIVETLGSIDPHIELAVAADGSRVAWIDRPGYHLWVADLRGPNQMVPRRLDADPNPEMHLRISADGRVVLSEMMV